MLQTNRSYLIPSAIAAVGLIALATACGSTDEGGGDKPPPPDVPCTDCQTPPASPPTGGTGDGTGTTLAVNRLFLGDSDRNLSPSPTAWQKYGYDLDGFKSTLNSTTHCKVNGDGSKSAIQTDGENGIDNSFGANIIPVITGLAQDAATKVNETIDEGKFTIILQVDTIGGGTDYVGLPAALYAGAQMESAPMWDGSDSWPVFCELMNDCKPTGTTQLADGNTSKVQFPGSYVAGGTWVSGSKGTVNLSLAISGFALSLDINQAVLTADLAAGTPPTAATNGIIAGVIESQALITSLTQIAGSISTTLCSGPTFDSVAQQIVNASDIMKDGTQDPSAFCDGISIGLGFDMKAVQIGTVLDQNPPGEDPCAGTQ